MESFGVYQRPLKIAKSPNLNKEKKVSKMARWRLWNISSDFDNFKNFQMQSLWKQIIVKFGNNTATLCLKPFLTHVAGWPGPGWRQMLFLFRHFVATWENQAGSNCCVERKSSQQNRENQENGKFTICFMYASAMQKLLQLSINLLLKILKVILVKDQDSANFSSILKMTNL